MKFLLGAAYYPEMWEESEVEKDIERCKSLGINVLRVAEFAWDSMEPTEGNFQLDWLVRVVDKLYAAGIYTVMCTPSATPPRWMLNKYEGIRRVDSRRHRVEVSDRCHPCKSSEIMREKNRLIVEQLAKTFAHHPGVVGWQIDNEIYPYDGGCYCEKCKANFRKWLKEKYGTLDNLNKKWGMVRWSLTYESWDAIQPPYPDQWKHPSLVTEWWRFNSALITSYINEQADILHRHGCTNVGTDMMQQMGLDYYECHQKLDIVQCNHYGDVSRLKFDAMWHNFLRCVKDKPFWITETQVGWNGSEFAESGYRPQGQCYANTWLPVALGASANMYWLFRTHPNGHEIGHGALYSAAGRQYKVAEEVKRFADDYAKCESALQNSGITSKIALHFSSMAERNLSNAPIVKNLQYKEFINSHYARVFVHHNVDVIDIQHGLEGYKWLISPFTTTFDDEFKQKVLTWIKDGGTWIVGPMSDSMTDYTSKYTDSPYPFIEQISGTYVQYQKPIDNNVFKAQWNDGEKLSIGTYFDALKPIDSTSLATYTNEEFEGYSVVTEKQIGKGKVVVVGSVLGAKDLLKLVGAQPILNATDNVRLTERDNGTIIAVEICNEQGFLQLDGSYTNLINGKSYSGKVEVRPYQVLVLKK